MEQTFFFFCLFAFRDWHRAIYRHCNFFNHDKPTAFKLILFRDSSMTFSTKIRRKLMASYLSNKPFKCFKVEVIAPLTGTFPMSCAQSMYFLNTQMKNAPYFFSLSNFHRVYIQYSEQYSKITLVALTFFCKQKVRFITKVC